MVVRPARLLLPVLVGTLVGCSSPSTEAPPGEPDPTASTPVAAGPELGAFHELLPDPTGDGLVLLTGPPEQVASGEPLVLWRWDGTAWAEVPASGEVPPARNFFAAAYDDTRDVVLLYGGDLPAAESATMWEWDGTRWRASEAGGPGPRIAASMSFDSDAGQAVLYGGDDGQGAILNDTWAWDGRAWAQLPGRGPSPPRFPGAMVTPPGGETVLFGGHQVVDEDLPPALADTWVHEGDGWRLVDGTGAEHDVVNARALVHPRLGTLVVGGSDLETERGDVLRWVDKRWEVVGRGAFPPRQAFGLGYDEARDVVVLTGGVVEPGSTARHQDVWEWSGDPATPATRVSDG